MHCALNWVDLMTNFLGQSKSAIKMVYMVTNLSDNPVYRVGR
jgi:hypothetical protein